MVHDFFSLSSESIIDQDGIVDNFRGDCVLAFFNVPIKHEDYIERAVAVAEEMQAAVAQVNERFGQAGLLRVGMSITSGMVYTAVVGSRNCKDYTIMGDAVNLGARLQDRAGPGEILVTDDVYGYVSDWYPDAKGVALEVKGIRGKVGGYVLNQEGSVNSH